jgi:hypothetical protein
MGAKLIPERLEWAIGARERSQRLMLALYTFGQQRYGSSDSDVSREAWAFSGLSGVAFSLWRAAFLADVPTRDLPGVLKDVQDLLGTVLATNAITFATEYKLQGWTGGYYLLNAKLRLQAIRRYQLESGNATAEDVARVERISLVGTNPHETWMLFCEEAEQIAQKLGCKFD